MNKRLRTIILVIIIVIALTLLTWWLWVKFASLPKVETTAPEPQKSTTAEQADDTLIQEELAKQIAGKSDEEISDQAKIMSAARFFVERYGSFSSQANWQNLTDVKLVVTRQLWDELNSLIQKNPIEEGGKYYSLTTKILGLRLVSQNDSLATVEAQTQKQEISQDENRIFYQDITVYFVKDGDSWLVTDFDWGQERQ